MRTPTRPVQPDDQKQERPGPQIDQETVCRLIVKAREIGAKESAGEADSGSSAIDDGFRGVLAATRDDPAYAELRAFIDDLDIDAQCDLVALTWIGRGDFTAADWAEVFQLARQEHNDRTSAYLLQTPLLPDYLAEGLSQFGMSCQEFEARHL